MSYDLFFTKPKITRADFESYFQKRRNYRLDGSQALYENEDTGTYFNFDHSESGDEEDPEATEYSAMFNINLFRPSYFILEAEPEVSAFVKHFKCEIEDPQGDGDGPYSADGLKNGWNHSNRFGYQAVLRDQEGPEKIFARPEEELTAIWKWNYKRAALARIMLEDIFIPRIRFGIFGGELASFCVWPDAISTLIPRVDRLWIPRSKLAPRPLFGRRKDDECVIPFATALPVLQPYHSDAHSLDAYKLPAPVPPKQIAAFVSKLTATKINVEGIGMDQVLTKELVDEARG